jgi:hypothetical protein
MAYTQCVTLVLRSIETTAGIAGKDFGEIRSLWPETAIAFPTADLVQLAAGRTNGLCPQADALVALAGRHVKWTSLAVQQQLIETDSHADYLIPRCLGTAASIRASLTPIYKDTF